MKLSGVAVNCISQRLKVMENTPEVSVLDHGARIKAQRKINITL